MLLARHSLWILGCQLQGPLNLDLYASLLTFQSNADPKSQVSDATDTIDRVK